MIESNRILNASLPANKITNYTVNTVNSSDGHPDKREIYAELITIAS